MTAASQHPVAKTIDIFVELTALGVGIVALAQGRDGAAPGSEALRAYERGLAKLRGQVQAVSALLPTNPCSCEGEFAMRLACMEWVKTVEMREALEQFPGVANPTPVKGSCSPE